MRTTIRELLTKLIKKAKNKVRRFNTIHRGELKLQDGISHNKEKQPVRRLGYPLQYYEGEWLTSEEAAANIEKTYYYIRRNKFAVLSLGVMIAAGFFSQSVGAEEIPGVPNPGKNVTDIKRPRPPFIILYPPPGEVETVSRLPFYLKAGVVICFIFGGFYVFLINNKITITIEAGKLFLDIEEID